MGKVFLKAIKEIFILVIKKKKKEKDMVNYILIEFIILANLNRIN